MQNLAHINRHQKIEEALATRQMCKILGTPPVGLDDEMIAGGDIRINRSALGPWLFATAALLVVALGAALFFGGAFAKPASATSTPPATTAPPSTDWVEIR